MHLRMSRIEASLSATLLFIAILCGGISLLYQDIYLGVTAGLFCSLVGLHIYAREGQKVGADYRHQWQRVK